MNWLDSLGEAVSDKVPKDFYTAAQISEARGLSVRRIRDLLAPAINRGEVVVKDFRVQCGRTIRPVPHYGPAKCKR